MESHGAVCQTRVCSMTSHHRSKRHSDFLLALVIVAWAVTERCGGHMSMETAARHLRSMLLQDVFFCRRLHLEQRAMQTCRHVAALLDAAMT